VSTGGTLDVTGGPFTTYQWYLNGVAITGATNATYVFTQNGNYTVKVSKDGCLGESVVYIVKNVGVDDLENQLVVISPNPASGMVQIEGYKPHEIRLFNSQGQLVLQRHEAKQFSVSHLASGIYYVQLYNKEGALLYRQKLIRE
jgi:DNA-binding beta-propeller fold protein YncE